MTRCVRPAVLLGEGDRKERLENRLEELVDIFAVAFDGFTLINTCLNLLVRLDPKVAQAWSDSRKASISAELAGIFERLGLSAQSWRIQIEKLRGAWLLGRFFTSSRAKLRQIAEHLGVRRLVNLRGCPI